MKKLKIAKKYGTWYYEKYKELDVNWPLYDLYNEKKEYVDTFGIYDDMKYYIETGINLSL